MNKPGVSNLIERIAARNAGLSVAELVKTLMIDDNDATHKIEIYYTHKLRAYSALVYEKDISERSEPPYGVWKLLSVEPTAAPSVEECIQNAIDALDQDWVERE